MGRYSTFIDSRNRIFVDLDLHSFNKTRTASIAFMYDSGADYSAISLADLATLGYNISAIKKLMYEVQGGSTADGRYTDWFSIDLNLNHILGQVIPRGLKFPFLCMNRHKIKIPQSCRTGCELTGEKYGGFQTLLGNDIISCFDISTDRLNSTASFTRLDNLSVRNARYPNSELLTLNTSDKTFPRLDIF